MDRYSTILYCIQVIFNEKVTVVEMKTYVVNMEKDTQKRALIEAQLAKHPELDYQIWKAVEGRKLSQDEQKRMILPEFFKRYGRNATLPAAGCSLSHIGIYRDMILTNIRYALILEDDAVLSSDLKIDYIRRMLETKEPVAILLTPDFWYHRKAEQVRVDDKFNIYRLRDGYMTSGYAVNIAAVKLILPKIFPVQFTADAWRTFVSFGVKLYGIVPHVISYPDGYGEIGMSQHVHKTINEKVRSYIVYIYICYLWVVSYMKGYRKSLKRWS